MERIEENVEVANRFFRFGEDERSCGKERSGTEIMIGERRRWRWRRKWTRRRGRKRERRRRIRHGASKGHICYPLKA